MTYFTKTLSAIAIVAAFGGTASASDNAFEARFAYDASQSVSETYAQFEDQAGKVCMQQIRRAGYRSASEVRAVKPGCVSELVAKAVKASGNSQLIAFHARETGNGEIVRMLAEK